jgi:hypothetical protein
MATFAANGCDVAHMPFVASTGERPGKWKSRILSLRSVWRDSSYYWGEFQPSDGLKVINQGAEVKFSRRHELGGGYVVATPGEA